jgi:segregation and condensation protein A
MNVAVHRDPCVTPGRGEKIDCPLDSQSSRPDAESMPVLAVSASPPETTDLEIRDMLFRVDLDIFRGPLDLLLYLVRKHELSILNIPIARITDQFVAHLDVLRGLDMNIVGDFLEMAGLLIEIKSKMLLPDVDEQSESFEDPRQDLVRQLLEYKQYKDAASRLDERSRDWQQCFIRLSNDADVPANDMADRPIREVELWDLVSAFGRIMRAHEAVPQCNIVYDETPIHVYMQRVHERLCDEGQIAFSDMFEVGMHKSSMIAIFLAVLELIRNFQVQVEQDELYGEIYLLGGEELSREFDGSQAEEYEHSSAAGTDTASLAIPTVKPR